MQKTITCDLDGVVVDCLRASLIFHGRPDLASNPAYPPTYSWEEDVGLTWKQFWGAIEGAGPRWWETLPYTPFGRELLDYLFSLEHKVEIATKVIGPNSAAGKLEWANRELPPRTPVYITTGDKSSLSHAGSVLIDDSPENVEEWIRRGGDAILVPAPYNVNRDLIGRELDLIKSELRRMGYDG